MRRSGRTRSRIRWMSSSARSTVSWSCRGSWPGAGAAGLISMTITTAPRRTRSFLKRGGRSISGDSSMRGCCGGTGGRGCRPAGSGLCGRAAFRNFAALADGSAPGGSDSHRLSSHWQARVRPVSLRTDDLVQMEVTDAQDRGCKVDLGVFWRARAPVMLDVGPVLHPDDAVAGKMDALFNRWAPRDFLDVDTILASGRYTWHQLMSVVA